MWLGAAPFVTSVHPPESSSPLGHTTPCDPEAPLPNPGCIWRHSGWRDDRNRVWQALHRTAQTDRRRAAFGLCGSTVYVLQSKTDPDRYRLAGSGCHDRFCLPCARARSGQIAQRVLQKIQGQPVRFITLTLQTAGEPLARSLDRLYKSFAKLRRSRPWKTRVTGGVAFLEIKWQPDAHRWHPHLHVLTQGTFFPQPDLKTAWLNATGDSHIVDIRLVRHGPKCSQYVTKYASKPFNSSFLHHTDRLDEALTALKSRRLALTFGTWRGYRLAFDADDAQWVTVGELGTLYADSLAGNEQAAKAIAAIDPVTLAVLLPRERPPPTPTHVNPLLKPNDSTLFPISKTFWN
jgi:hypothetical protein